MTNSTDVDDLLDAVAKILLRCWILGFVLLLFWFGAVMLAGDLVFGVHGRMFDLTFGELARIHYCGMMLTKLVVGVCFLIPWVATHMVLKQRKRRR